MVQYVYPPNTVLNPSTGEPLLLGSGRVYATSDTGLTTPLMVTHPGGSTSTTVQVLNGASKSFYINDRTAVLWVDTTDPSLRGVLQPVLPGVPGGGTTGQAMIKLSNSDYHVGWGEGAGSGSGEVFPGTLVVVRKNGVNWPPRPTADANTVCAWLGASPAPPIVSSGTAGMRDNLDFWWRI